MSTPKKWISSAPCWTTQAIAEMKLYRHPARRSACTQLVPWSGSATVRSPSPCHFPQRWNRRGWVMTLGMSRRASSTHRSCSALGLSMQIQ